MGTTGIIILVFVLLHLAHYTFGWVHNTTGPDGTSVNLLSLRDAQGRHDVYTMVIAGFRNPVMSILYIAAQLVLLVHLSHGIASSFQSLGLNSPRYQPIIRGVGWTVALGVTLGNIVIVLAVWTGIVKSVIPRRETVHPQLPQLFVQFSGITFGDDEGGGT